MKISLFTNRVNGGWHPRDLETFLGGNEESIVLFAAALSNLGHSVEVYGSFPETFEWLHGTQYFPREKFDFDAPYDVLISVKDRAPWIRSVDARVKIHWSNDVEPPWSTGCLSAVDHVVLLSTFHQDRMPWVPAEKRSIIPLGCNLSLYKPGKKNPNLAIYATSPDRGLDILLRDWGRIRSARPKLELFVTYDWKGIAGSQMAAQLQAGLQQPGIKHGLLTQKEMAALFQQANYYIHCLNRPDSDTFGFGPMKAQMAECKLVLPSVANNGFRDMVRSFIPYRDFLAGRDTEQENPAARVKPQSWGDIAAQKWLPLIESFSKEVRHAG